jgi:dipeptidyl aminopeptidase/acylaminoacyl peptidase
MNEPVSKFPGAGNSPDTAGHTFQTRLEVSVARSICLNILLCLATLVVTGAPQLVHAVPPAVEAFYKDPDLREAVLSPSGKRLAITAQGKGHEFAGLVIIDLAPGGKADRISQYVDGDVVNVYWVNDERLVFSIVDLSEGSGQVNGAPGLFAINADGTKFRRLVQRQGTAFFNDGRDANVLEWNHVLLGVPDPKEGTANEDILISQYSKDEHGFETPLWLNTRTGRTRSIVTGAPSDVVGWIADSRGELRVAFTHRENRQAAYWRGPGETKWDMLYESGLMNRPFNVNSVDAAGNLYVTEAEGAGGTYVLKRYDFSKRAPAEKALVVTPGFDFRGGLVTDGKEALGVRVNVDAEATLWFNGTMKALQEQVDGLLPGRVNRITCRRCGQADMVALVRSYSDRDPGQLLVYHAQPANGAAPFSLVGRVREDLKPEEMAGTDFHRIKARDGLDLPVWVTRPVDAKGPLPAVVLVHGGPWVRGRFWGWSAHAQFLATRGYVVIEPEMRGSTGYGDAHYTAGFKQFGQAMQDDVADALRWAQKQGLAGDKACIAGASYGGYSTLMGLVNDPDLFQCGVAWLAVTDLNLLLTGSWRVTDDASSASRKYTLPELVGEAVKDADMIAKNSPVNQASRIKAPLLLAFGEEDRRVPLEHGKRLRAALKAAGNDPVWVTYAGEGHGFAVMKNRLDFAKRMEAFLAKHLGAAKP